MQIRDIGMSAIDKRQIERLELSIPAILRFWSGQQNGPTEHRTKNISSKGAFLYADMEAPIGAGVNLDFVLPNHVHIQVDGLVVRSNESGFAVHFGPKYQIIPESLIHSNSPIFNQIFAKSHNKTEDIE